MCSAAHFREYNHAGGGTECRGEPKEGLQRGRLAEPTFSSCVYLAHTLRHIHCTYTAGTAEADIFFLRARQAGGQGGLFYNDFVQLCVDVCVRAASGRVGGAARRLEQHATRAAADGDEESEEQPRLDEQLRTLLSRMVTGANTAVAA